MPIDKFPQEIWCGLAQYLSVNDLLQLRLVSHQIDELITYERIWKTVCYTQWLQHQEWDTVTDYNDRFDDGANWFHSFLKRQRMDNELIRLLKRLIVIQTHENEYWYLVSKFLLREDCNMLIPILHRVIEESPPNKSFQMANIANDLLMAIRHRDIFQIIRGNYSNSYNNRTFESMLLKYGEMDPAYDRLLSSRATFLHSVESELNRAYPRGLDPFHELHNISKIRVLYDIIHGILKHDNVLESIYIEDFMILRVYAGETKGHPLVVLVILQYVASLYGIHVNIASKYLVIKEKNNLYFYLTLTPKHGIKIFSQRKLESIIGRGSRFSAFMRPLTNTDLINIINEEFTFTSKSNWNNEVDSVAESTGIEMWRKLYPESRMPFPVDTMIYYNSICGLQHTIHTLQTSNPRSRIRVTCINELNKAVLNSFPFDMIYLQDDKDSKYSCPPWQNEEDYQNWLYNKYSVRVPRFQYTRITEPIGTFLFAKNDKLVVILGIKHEYSMVRKPIQYVTVMDHVGQVFVEFPSNLSPVDWDGPHNEAVLDEFMEMVRSTNRLGTFFSSWDRSSHRLVPLSAA